MVIPKNLVVSALGEVFQGRKCVSGTLNLAKLQSDLGRKPSNADIDRAFKRQLRAAVNAKTAARVESVWRLQKLNNARFRIWARGERVFLSTEFRAFTDDSTAWKTIRAAAKHLGVKPNTLHKGPHDDTISYDGGKTWVHGENHGRQERQVSVDITLTALTTKAARAKIQKAAKATQAAWESYGVGVI